jgi:hypothetical protein
MKALGFLIPHVTKDKEGNEVTARCRTAHDPDALSATAAAW